MNRIDKLVKQWDLNLRRVDGVGKMTNETIKKSRDFNIFLVIGKNV